MKRRLSAVPLAALAALLLAGCTSGERTDSLQTVETTRPGGTPRTVVVDPAFGDALAVGEVLSRRVEDVLQVQVQLRSRSQETLMLETKLEWFDADGFKVDDSTEVWKPLDLAGGATAEVRGSAPGKKAVTYRFSVRAANPIRPVR